MKTAMKLDLTIQEFKAICKMFFDEGRQTGMYQGYSSGRRSDLGVKIYFQFDDLFDEVFEGKYNRVIKNEGWKIKFEEMMEAIEKEMEDFDREKKIKAAKSIEDLRNFIITC